MAHLRRKYPHRYNVNYQLMMEPELKQRIMELKVFYNIDCPEHIRELIRLWIEKVDEQLKSGQAV